MAHTTSKTTFSDGIEVGVLREDDIETLAYATLGGLTVFLSEQEDGTVRVQLKPQVRGGVKATVATHDGQLVADVQFN